MPTPVGHSLAALAIQVSSGKTFTRSVWLTRAILVFVGSLPDIDFVPGYLAGDPRLYHWSATHSLTAALLVGVLVGSVARKSGGKFSVAFWLTTAVYASHILLDLLLGPGAPAIGIQVFWPFSMHRYMSSWSVFMMFPSSIERIGPIAALFSRDILPVIAHEILVLLPVLGAVWLMSWMRLQRVAAHASEGVAGQNTSVTNRP